MLVTEHREVAAEAVRKAVHAAFLQQSDESRQELAGAGIVAQEPVNEGTDVRELVELTNISIPTAASKACSRRSRAASALCAQQRLHAQQEDLVGDVPFHDECARPLEHRRA